uniref:Uncharacterized protein n=1 Tax=Cyanoderma ruficeps TaxID=181631 RepID=A0A8C3P4J4_9PASS
MSLQRRPMQTRFSRARCFTPGVLLPEVLTVFHPRCSPPRGADAAGAHVPPALGYIPGTHSIALVTCLNEQIARDIARYFWKGELEESTEILAGQGAEPPAGLTPLLRASFRFRSIHPFEIPDIVSLPIHQGNPLYLRWIGENVPSGTTTLPCVPIPT